MAIGVLGLISSKVWAYNQEHKMLQTKLEATSRNVETLEQIRNDLKTKHDTLQLQLQEEKKQVETKTHEVEDLNKKLQAKLEKNRLSEARLASNMGSISSFSQTPRTEALVSCETYRSLVAQYGWNVDTAMQVMKAESGCNPGAANTTDNHGVCMGSFGLFQISCHSGAVYDPAQNVAIAWSKYQKSGWQPWGVCTSGKVRCV